MQVQKAAVVEPFHAHLAAEGPDVTAVANQLRSVCKATADAARNASSSSSIVEDGVFYSPIAEFGHTRTVPEDVMFYSSIGPMAEPRRSPPNIEPESTVLTAASVPEVAPNGGDRGPVSRPAPLLPIAEPGTTSLSAVASFVPMLHLTVPTQAAVPEDLPGTELWPAAKRKAYSETCWMKGSNLFNDQDIDNFIEAKVHAPN